MSIEAQLAQKQFLMAGGVFQRILAKAIEVGHIPAVHEFHEYPKMLRLSKGIQTTQHQTLTCDREIKRWTEDKEIFEEITVNSEEEEERVLAGGKTSAQIESDRQTLIARCRSAGILVDTNWSVVRLRRELGDKLDTPNINDLGEVTSEMSVLKEKLARLQEVMAMRDKIASLEAELAKPLDDPEDMASQLLALGVRPDKRWSLNRLREELERAQLQHGVQTT